MSNPVEPIDLLENCQVEWDKRRGVLYVHNKDTGQTVIRISNLPACRDTVSLSQGQIDITAAPLSVTMPHNA